jgi:hypothetical protein
MKPAHGFAATTSTTSADNSSRMKGTMKNTRRNKTGVPAVVDRSIFQAELDALRVREKTHTREGNAITAARRRLPKVEMEARSAYGRARDCDVVERDYRPVAQPEGQAFRRSGHSLKGEHSGHHHDDCFRASNKPILSLLCASKAATL